MSNAKTETFFFSEMRKRGRERARARARGEDGVVGRPLCVSVVAPRVLNTAIKDANVSISQSVRVRKCTSACACILLCDALGIVLRRIMSTSTELAFALYELGLLSYAGKLRTAGVNDVRKLAEVDEEKLIAAGIEKVGPRRKLLNAAAVRREGGSPHHLLSSISCAVRISPASEAA